MTDPEAPESQMTPERQRQLDEAHRNLAKAAETYSDLQWSVAVIEVKIALARYGAVPTKEIWEAFDDLYIQRADIIHEDILPKVEPEPEGVTPLWKGMVRVMDENVELIRQSRKDRPDE